MNLFKKIFGDKDSKQTQQPKATSSEPKSLALGLADPLHPARHLIDQASRIADREIWLEAGSGITMIQVNNKAGTELVALIEQALNMAPNDMNLLLAKSAALCCEMSFKSAEDVIDEILRRDPDNLDARQRKALWQDWPHLFQYPSWSTAVSNLTPDSQMLASLKKGQRVQLVRDGLQIGVAIVSPADGALGVVPKNTSCAWIPMWIETPYTPIVAHYTVVRDHPADPLKFEAFLPTFEGISPKSSYWLLQRLSRIASCFIVVVDGAKVIYNGRYIFPPTVKDELHRIAARVAQLGEKAQNTDAFEQALRWHMNNFDIGRIK